jgi:Cdc6-like AAA superfamily ATPase
LTKEDLRSIGIPLGPATNLYLEIEKINSSKQDLKTVIEDIYKKNNNWKCLMEKPENLPFDGDIEKFIGREKEIELLLINSDMNITKFLNKVVIPQHYTLPLIYGGMGVGKTSLIAYFSSILEKKLESKILINFSKIVNIYINFNIDDSCELQDTKISSNLLGLRIASHFFFGKSSKIIENKYQEYIKFFTLDDILSLINKLYIKPTNKNLIIILHMDEFQQIKKELLNEFIRNIASLMTRYHEYGICILPFLSGTDVESEVDLITRSNLTISKILISPLTSDQIEEIFKNYLSNIKELDFLFNSEDSYKLFF